MMRFIRSLAGTLVAVMLVGMVVVLASGGMGAQDDHVVAAVPLAQVEDGAESEAVEARAPQLSPSPS